MTVTTRRFSASPVRTAAQVWEAIVTTIAGNNEQVRQELTSILGIAASLISDYTPKSDPITVIGSGPRLRIYCLYEEDGSTEDASEGVLHWNLFESDWEMYLPVNKDDLDWVRKALKGSKHFKVYETGTKITEENTGEQKAPSLTINLKKLKENG
jgi:hypothetical protein